MTSPYAKTLDQITDGTLRLIEDFRGDGLNGRIYTRAEVKRAVNEALLDLVDRVECLKSSEDVPISAGVSTYDFPTDCLRPLRLGLSGLSGAVVLPARLSDLDLFGLARSATGTPYEMYREFLAYNQFGVLPTPTATGTMQVYYIKSPEKLVNGWDYPETGVPVVAHKDLKYGAAIILLSGSLGVAPKPNKLKRFNDKWTKVVARVAGYCGTFNRSQDMSPC